jgi:hypothetical protein
MSEGNEDRKRLTFEQAEGAAPIPSSFALKELSPELRARLRAIVHDSLARHSQRADFAGRHLLEPWEGILEAMHVYRYQRPADEYTSSFAFQCGDRSGQSKTEGSSTVVRAAPYVPAPEAASGPAG